MLNDGVNPLLLIMHILNIKTADQPLYLTHLLALHECAESPTVPLVVAPQPRHGWRVITHTAEGPTVEIPQTLVDWRIAVHLQMNQSLPVLRQGLIFTVFWKLEHKNLINIMLVNLFSKTSWKNIILNTYWISLQISPCPERDP